MNCTRLVRSHHKNPLPSFPARLSRCRLLKPVRVRRPPYANWTAGDWRHALRSPSSSLSLGWRTEQTSRALNQTLAQAGNPLRRCRFIPPSLVENSPILLTQRMVYVVICEGTGGRGRHTMGLKIPVRCPSPVCRRPYITFWGRSRSVACR